LAGAAPRQRLANVKGHTWTVQFVAFAPDGKTLASQSINGNDATLKQWDLDKGQESKSVNGWFGFCRTTPDRKATAFFHYQDVVLLDVTTLKSRQLPRAGLLDVVACAAFSPRGELLFTGNGAGVYRYDVASGKVGLVHETHSREVSSVAASADGKTIASGSHDGMLILWDVEKKRVQTTIPAHNQGAILIRYSPDGKNLYSTSTADSRLRAWDPVSGKECARLDAPAKARALRLDVSPNGQALAVLYTDGTLKLVDLAQDRFTRP
jgi:WD40 repeat protein